MHTVVRDGVHDYDLAQGSDLRLATYPEQQSSGMEAGGCPFHMSDIEALAVLKASIEMMSWEITNDESGSLI
eukprot:2720577-Amphidinium_carterae.1